MKKKKTKDVQSIDTAPLTANVRPGLERLRDNISTERIDVLKKMGICKPAIEWLTTPGRTYDHLSEHPEYAFLSAKYYGGDLATMQAIVIAHGTPELRRKFATHVPGADKEALLAGLD